MAEAPNIRTDTRYAMVARHARALLASGREHYVCDAIAEAFIVAPVDGLPAHPTIADYRAAAALV
jgi:hypothetical protein